MITKFTIAFVAVQVVLCILWAISANSRKKLFLKMFNNRMQSELSDEELELWDKVCHEHQYSFRPTRIFELIFIVSNFPAIILQALIRRDNGTNYLVTIIVSYVLYLGIACYIFK